MVLTGGTPLAEGTVVQVIPIEEVAAPSLPALGQNPPYPVSEQQKEALLNLIGMWKAEHPPNDDEVERIREEYRTKKYA